MFILTESLLLFVISNAWGLNTFEPAGWENISLKIYTVPSQIIPSIDNNCSNHIKWVTAKFCTCHDSTAVVACAKFCCDNIPPLLNGRKWVLGIFQVGRSQPFLKRSPDVCQWMGSLYLIYKHQALSGPWAKMDTRIWMIHTGRFLTHWHLNKIYNWKKISIVTYASSTLVILSTFRLGN